MIRIIVQTTDCGAAVNVGGPVETTFRTFDLPSQHSELEAFMADAVARAPGQLWHRSFVGVEYLPAPPPTAPDAGMEQETSDG